MDHHNTIELNESQEVEDILRQLDLFQLHPNQPRQSSPLTDHASSSTGPSATSSSATHHSSQIDDLRHEEDQNELDRWNEGSGQEESDDSTRHLCLQGARNFLDPSLFVPVTAVDEDALRNLSELWQEAQREREKTRRWAERMRNAVESWVQVRKNINAIAIQTLEDQLIEALQNCRRKEQKIQQLELLVAELESDLVTTNPHSKSLRTPTKEPKAQNVAATAFQSLPPPTVSPQSPLSDGSSTNASSVFFHRHQSKKTDPSSELKSKQRRHRIKNGCEIIEYSNGATREIYNDHEVLRHRNRDVEIIYPDHCRYYYDESKTLRITDSEKTTYYYSNSQSEIHWNDGRKLIRFADGTLHEVEHSIAATV